MGRAVIDWLRRSPDAAPESEPVVVDIGGRSMPLLIRRHAKAKRMTMRLSPDGGAIRITMPRWAASSEAMVFIKLRQDWLEEQVGKLPEPTIPEPGDIFAYCGRDVLIDWQAKARRRPRLEDDRLVLGGPTESLQKRISKWLENEAKQVLACDLTHYCDVAECEVPELRLSRAQRRWGSCSGKGTIRINWRLIQAPEPVRRSVVAHEVAHLFHFDHSPDFHALLARLFEGDIAEADHWLKTKGRSLYAQFG
jgi:predicted metal-dependent hydrolase